MALKRFLPQQVYLTKEQAWDVLRFFFPNAMGGLSSGSLTAADCAFAQALLVEAIDASCNLGYVEAAFRSFAGKIPGAFSLAAFAARAGLHWFKYAKADDLKDPKIYEVVRLTLQRNFSTVWQLRVAGGGYVGAYDK